MMESYCYVEVLMIVFFEYMFIVFGLIVLYFLFGDVFELMMFFGIVIVICVGVFIIYCESKFGLECKVMCKFVML